MDGRLLHLLSPAHFGRIQVRQRKSRRGAVTSLDSAEVAKMEEAQDHGKEGLQKFEGRVAEDHEQLLQHTQQPNPRKKARQIVSQRG